MIEDNTDRKIIDFLWQSLQEHQELVKSLKAEIKRLELELSLLKV